MNYLTKNLLKISASMGFCFIGSIFATSTEVKANTCNANNPSSISDSCYVTPSTYKIRVYEMGLCISDPLAGTYINESDEVVTDNNIDETTCTKTFESETGSLVDLGGSASQSLTGTNFRPAAGTYPSAYIKIKNTFVF